MPTKSLTASSFENESKDAGQEDKDGRRGGGSGKSWPQLLTQSKLITYYRGTLVAQIVLVGLVYAAGSLTGLDTATSSAEDGGGGGSSAPAAFVMFLSLLLLFQLMNYKRHVKVASDVQDGGRGGGAPTEKEMHDVFREIDEDHSGMVNNRELQKAMQSFGHDISLREADDMIYEADVDKNGGVDYEEFTQIVEKANQGHAARNGLWLKADTSMHAQVTMANNQSWHGKMCFLPVIVMIICTLMASFGLASALFHYATKVDPCALGIVEGVANLDLFGTVVTLGIGISLGLVYLLSTLLSFTHFKIYQEMSVGISKLAGEVSGAAGQPDVHQRAQANAKKPTAIWFWYMLGIVSQLALFLGFSLAKTRLENAVTEIEELELAASFSGNTTLTAHFASSKVVSIVMHSMMTFAVFHIGHQLGAMGEYRRYSKGVEKWGDTFQIRKRMNWHGSKMYNPCLVAIIQSFIFFPTVFQLVPYYRSKQYDDTGNCPTDFVLMLSSMDGQGTFGLIVAAAVFGGMQFCLTMLSMTHFKQFVKYNSALL